MKKKVLSLLVTFAMVFSMFPATALAASATVNTADDLRTALTSATIKENSILGSVEADNVPAGETVDLSGNYWGGDAPSDLPEGVTISSYYIDEAMENAVTVPTGTITPGYTSNEGKIWGEAKGNAEESFVIKVYSGDTLMGTTSLNNVGGIIDGDVHVTWSIKLDTASNADEYWTMNWVKAPSVDIAPDKVVLCVDGVDVAENLVQLNAPDNLKKIVAATADSNGSITGYYTTLADALSAAADGATVQLLSGSTAISAAGEVYGKTVTITGKAVFDWSKGNLFVGRGGEGDGTLIFKNAVITSSSNNNSTGIHVSGREKNTDNKYDGTLVIDNSTIELDYLINRGTIEVIGDGTIGETPNLEVKNGFGIAGRPASETESGEAATATITIKNGAYVKVLNHNGMGVGTASTSSEGYGVLNLEDSKFECDSFNVTKDLGTFNVSGESVVAIDVLSGGGVMYLNGVELDENTVITGTEAGIIKVASGTNNISGSTIEVKTFQVGTGKEDSNVAPTENVVVNLMDGAVLSTKGSDYDGWVGSKYGNTISDVRYILNIDESVATFGYLHVSKDGVLNVKGDVAEEDKANIPSGNYTFYVGNFIVNGVATLDDVDTRVQYGKVSVDNTDTGESAGTLNIKNCDEIVFAAEGNTNSALKWRNSGVVNIENSTVSARTPNITATGALNLVGSEFSTSNTAITNAGTITMDAASKITATDIAGDGEVAIDATGFTGIKTVIDINNASTTLTNAKIIVGDVTIKRGDDGDVMLVNVGSVESGTLYVNTDWTSQDAIDAILGKHSGYTYGTNVFATLDAAIAAAQSGDTLTLLDDVALTTTFAIPAEMTPLTIDGNGHKITPAYGFTADGNGAALVLANGDTDYSANSKYTIKNLTFEGFTGLTRVVRANFCDAKIDNCSFLDNTVSEGVITSAYAKLTVNGCAFTNNTITEYAAIYVGGDVSTYTTHVANITGNSFTQNKAGVAVIYLTSSANVTGNYFYGNTHTGSNSNGATILAGPYNDEKEEGAYTINIMENAFVGTMGGKPAVYAEDWSAEYNANTAFDLSANYWNGEKPVEGVAYATSGSNPAIKLDSYYTTISEGTGELGDLKTHYAARIGDQEYATLAEAVNVANAAADAVTIELLENIELSAGLKINNTSQAAITINGKGHVISPADGATFTGLIVEVRTDVAIHDVVFENFTTSSDIIAAYNGADLTLNGCTFQNNTCRTVITCTSGYENAFAAVDCTFSNNTDTRGVIYNGSSGATATFSVADSTFTGNTTGGAGIVNVGGVAIITGNAFSNNMVDTTNNVAGVLYPWNIDVTVTNNSFSGNTVQVTHTEGKPIIAASAIVVKSGDTTNDLSGNTITADNTVQTRISADADWTIGDTAVYVRDTGEGVVSITSGTINGSITSTDAGISITGGTFSVDPSEYVASGYVVNTVSGKYVVSEQPPTSGGGSTPPTVTVPVSSDSGSANVSASISGTAVTVSITDQDLSQVIASAGNTGNVVIDVSGLNNVTSAVIPSKVITAVNGAEDATGLTVALPGGSVGLDSDALAAVAAAAGGADVTMSVETVDTSKLSESQQAVLGNQISNAIVVDVSIMAQGTAISSFDGGTVTISVPYEPEEGTDTSKLVVWYLADDGTISPVEGAYDPATKSFVFKTSHLSTYALVSFPFEDVTAGSWYYGNVAYVFNNNLFNGTSSSTFSPDDTMTRAMLMTVLARMAGQDTAVEDGVWYEKGMNWAVENGISDGTNPEGSITREQLVTMLYRYAGSPEASGDLSAFSDADKVDGYATLAMQWAVGKGLINGMGDGTLAPRDTATRAQVAAILMRFCENIIA